MNFNQTIEPEKFANLKDEKIKPKAILKEAWELTQKPGVKLECWKANIIMFLLSVVTMTMVFILTPLTFSDYSFSNALGLRSLTTYLISAEIGTILSGGIYFFIIRYIKHNDLNYKNFFGVFKKKYIIPLSFYSIILCCLQFIVNVSNIFSNIFSYIIISLISFFFIFVIPLIVDDRSSNIIDILKMACKALLANFQSYITIYLITLLLTIISIITLCIGFFWALPLQNIIWVVAYIKTDFKELDNPVNTFIVNP